MSRLTVLCFAGTYLLALFAELARPLARGAARWWLALGLTALGWVVHTVFLANLAWTRHELPVTTLRESLLVLSWILGAIDLYLVARSPRNVAVGAFLLPIVLGLAAFGGLATGGGGAATWPGWVEFWGTVHGILLMAGATATCVAFAAGLMYLLQASRLKHKRPSLKGFALPSLEQSERLNRGAIIVAFPMLTFGFLIGIVLIVLTRRASSGVALGWTDPKVVSAALLWLMFAGLLNARFRPAMRGRRVMVLTIVAFGFLIFTWAGVGLFLPTEHGMAAKAGRSH